MWFLHIKIVIKARFVATFNLNGRSLQIIICEQFIYKRYSGTLLKCGNCILLSKFQLKTLVGLYNLMRMYVLKTCSHCIYNTTVYFDVL